jgi:hypothetical protein
VHFQRDELQALASIVSAPEIRNQSGAVTRGHSQASSGRSGGVPAESRLTGEHAAVKGAEGAAVERIDETVN